MVLQLLVFCLPLFDTRGKDSGAPTMPMQPEDPPSFLSSLSFKTGLISSSVALPKVIVSPSGLKDQKFKLWIWKMSKMFVIKPNLSWHLKSRVARGPRLRVRVELDATQTAGSTWRESHVLATIHRPLVVSLMGEASCNSYDFHGGIECWIWMKYWMLDI